MISMCGKRRAMLVSVMDGQSPHIKCEGRWRAPYMAAPYGEAIGVGSPMCQSRRDERPTGSLGVPLREVGGAGYSLLDREAVSRGTRSPISQGETRRV